MGKYDQDIADAQAAIAEAGQLVTWRQTTEVVPDANKPWIKNPGAPADFPVTIAFLPVKRVGEETQRDLPDSRDKSGSVRGIMAGGLPFTPSGKDIVIRGGKTLHVDSMDVIAPDGDPIIYKILFKG